ncbi:hypothetical protein G6F60_015630 [Rhizopus arrhizus]|nr:hypothetical protein G6F60_015630 [Rhizopus arrhizus]KAG1480906.1 hypothetical protein G6F53_014178 [Rhizopus delemar]
MEGAEPADGRSACGNLRFRRPLARAAAGGRTLAAAVSATTLAAGERGRPAGLHRSITRGNGRCFQSPPLVAGAR